MPNLNVPYTHKPKSVRLEAYTLLFLSALFWAGNAVLGKAITTDIPPVGLAFWRWALASLFLFPFAHKHLRKDWKTLNNHLALLLVLALLGVTLFNTLLYTGLHFTSSINAVLLQTLLPSIVSLLAYFIFHEQLKTRQILGLIIAFFGASIIIFQGNSSNLFALRLNFGDLIISLAVLALATYTILLKKRPKIHPLSFLLITFLLGTPFILPFYLLESYFIAPVSFNLTTGMSFLYVGIFPSILAFLFYDRGVRLIGAQQASQLFYVTPILGFLLSISLLGEKFYWFHLYGISIIFIGITLAAAYKRLDQTPKDTSIKLQSNSINQQLILEET